MSSRLAVTILLTLSLVLSGSVWAHGPLPDHADTVADAAVDPTLAGGADGAPANVDEASATQPVSDCGHQRDVPAVPAIDDKGTEPGKSGHPNGCCADGSCACVPPIGKGMAIGPAHLAIHGTPAPYAPVAAPVLMDPSHSLLRPPIP